MCVYVCVCDRPWTKSTTHPGKTGDVVGGPLAEGGDRGVAARRVSGAAGGGDARAARLVAGGLREEVEVLREERR